MNKKISFSGFCPTKGDEHTIRVTYLDVTSHQSAGKEYIKGLADCNIASFGNCPIANECPIIAAAPDRM